MEKMQDEIEYWKSRCRSVEERVDNILSSTSDEHDEHTPALSKNKKSELKVELDNIKEINKKFNDLEMKLTKGLQAISENFQVSKQYHQRNSIIIKGYKYLPNMNNWDFITATVNELNCLFPSLNGIVHPIHIDDAHPLSKHSVIVKFSNRWVKNAIIKFKRDLVGTGLIVTEHLTPHTIELVAAAEKIVGSNSNVWVHNTLVFARVGDTRYSIRTAQDLDVLANVVKEGKTNVVHVHPQTQNESGIHMNNSDVSPTQHCSQENSNNTNTNDAKYQSSPCTVAPVPDNSNNYLNNYPALFNSLFYCNNNYTKTSTLRGRPSRNGRGRHPTRGSYNVRNRRY